MEIFHRALFGHQVPSQIQHYPSRFKTWERISWLEQWSQNWWLRFCQRVGWYSPKSLQQCGKFSIYVSRVIRWAWIWYKMWHVVTWRHTLFALYIETSIRSKQSFNFDQQNKEWCPSTNWLAVHIWTERYLHASSWKGSK